MVPQASNCTEGANLLAGIATDQKKLIARFEAAIPTDAAGNRPFSDDLWEQMQEKVDDALTAIVTALGQCSLAVYAETQQATGMRQQYNNNGFPQPTYPPQY